MKKTLLIFLLIPSVFLLSQKKAKPSKEETMAWILNKLNTHMKFPMKKASIKDNDLVLDYTFYPNPLLGGGGYSQSKDYQIIVPISDFKIVSCLNCTNGLWHKDCSKIFIYCRTKSILNTLGNDKTYSVCLEIICDDEENLATRLNKSFVNLKSYMYIPKKSELF